MLGKKTMRAACRRGIGDGCATGEPPNIRALQAREIEAAMLAGGHEVHDEHEAPVYGGFLWGVLYEQDFGKSAAKMLEIAKGVYRN